LLADARRRDLPVIDELELGWRLGLHPTVAVTGTNGKSTTTSLIATALRADGHATALAGNIEAVQGGEPLCQLPPEYSGWVVAEISSYQAVGLDLMLPDAAVFTNLTPDHLLWHGSMEAYGQAKRRVFIDGSRSVELAVINIDDPFGKKLAEDVRTLGGHVLTYGWDRRANYHLQACDWLCGWSRISLNTPTGPLRVRTALPGAHNAANLTAALAAADGLGLARGRALPAIASASAPPGRLERVDCEQGFDVFVDFAHSEDGIACVLAALRGITQPRGGRLIAVVALPQGTRPTRRACGRAARTGCEQLILTAYSARGEPPLRPLAWTLEGAREVQGATLEIALQRRTAIARALSVAQPGDVVAILGRGPLQTLACDRHGGHIPFDDRQVARELLLSDGREREVGQAQPAAAV
jgi:UDP-N-acetylmuramoyl-L-alanyl-D-glutamate--2,6-diaminopimelate ligase